MNEQGGQPSGGNKYSDDELEVLAETEVIVSIAVENLPPDERQIFADLSKCNAAQLDPTSLSNDPDLDLAYEAMEDKQNLKQKALAIGAAALASFGAYIYGKYVGRKQR